MADQPPQEASSSSGPDMSYLDSLNPAQLTATTYPRDAPLQILAGPGSGKTRVLTARVAYLVHHWGLRPWEITAVTFTNKAAKEMRKRLNKLLGEDVAGRLILGTFHATCAGYLRKHGRAIGLPNNFSIIDADDAKKIIHSILKPLLPDLKSRYISIKDSQAMSEISKAKAKEESPEGMKVRAEALGTAGAILVVIADIYKQYEDTLRAADALDFDDLLLFGLKLFRAAPTILQNCKHILVDEFQDTNTTQYELMKLFAKSHGNVTVVGDPDQSIYGWRSAEIENLDHMKRDFKGTDEVRLEENYRSTGAILAASLAVVSQDKKRAAKGLYTSHDAGYPVSYKQLPSAFIEAAYIAEEIKKMIAYSGNMLDHNDFAVLLRYNALSRPIEVALQKAGIPSRLMGGHKFFERVEVKDLLAYLQLADNPNFHPAFVRVINVPKRAIGDKSVQDILAQAATKKITGMELCERIVDGENVEGIKTGLKKNLVDFVQIVRELRVHAKKGTAVSDLIKLLIEKIEYEEYLRKTQPDFDSRWENVQELINYAVIVATEQSNALNLPEVELELDGFMSARDLESPLTEDDAPGPSSRPMMHPMFSRSTSGSSSVQSASSELVPPMSVRPARQAKPAPSGNNASEAIDLEYDEDDELDEDAAGLTKPRPVIEALPAGVDVHRTPLRTFLEASMLSTDTESQEAESNVPKVTISTAHAAKGLEWPVVFLPCLEEGTYPFYRSTEDQEIREERRLLYVAMTRAQIALVLSSALTRMVGGVDMDRMTSPFLSAAMIKSPDLFTTIPAGMTSVERAVISKVLERPPIAEEACKAAISAYNISAKPLPAYHSNKKGGTDQMFWFNSHKKESRATDYWQSESDEYALPPMERNAARRTMNVPTDDRFEPAEAVVGGFTSAKSRFMEAAEKRMDSMPVASTSAVPNNRRNATITNAASASRSAKLEYQEAVFGGDLGDVSAPKVKKSNNFTAAAAKHMPSLGLPAPITYLAAPKEEPSGSKSPGVNGFQAASSSSLAMMKGLGIPEDIPTKPGGGNKRLGMGGRPAPWGAKRPKT